MAKLNKTWRDTWFSPQHPWTLGCGLMKCLGGKVGPHCVLFNLAAWSTHFFCNLALPTALTPSFNVNVLYIFNMPFPQLSIPCYLDNSLFFSVHLHKPAGTGLCLSAHRGRVKPNWGAPLAQVLSFRGCPFQLCMVVRSRQLCPGDFCWPAAGLLWSSMLWSSFPTCATRSLCSLSWKCSPPPCRGSMIKY